MRRGLLLWRVTRESARSQDLNEVTRLILAKFENCLLFHIHFIRFNSFCVDDDCIVYFAVARARYRTWNVSVSIEMDSFNIGSLSDSQLIDHLQNAVMEEDIIYTVFWLRALGKRGVEDGAVKLRLFRSLST